MSSPALKIQNLAKSFGGVPAVDNLSLTIEPGEIFGLLGPNGAGKSTTINMIAGVTRVDQGSIQVFGYDNQTQYREARCLVGVMHQELVFDPFFRIDGSLKIYPGYFGCDSDPAWRDQVIDRLALRPHMKKHMTKLSGGMKRRFMLAKALIHKPKLVILDEPTAGVDVELRHSLWEFVREINKEGTTILLTTHYLEEAEEMCDRVAIMKEGQVVAVDHTGHLMKRFEERIMTVRTTTPLDEAPAWLPKQAKYKDGALEFRITEDLPPGEVVGLINAQGLTIKDLQTDRTNLEDAFLHLTRGSSS